MTRTDSSDERSDPLAAGRLVQPAREPLRRLAAVGAVSAALVGALVIALALAGRNPTVAGEEEATDFIRFVDLGDGEGKLETAVAVYEGSAPEGEAPLRVDLIAAVHIGDRAYYRQLQKRFETYDALLYEMIKPADVEPVPDERPDNLLSLFQRTLKDALDLDFQLDAIDYRRKNFVHADLDPETFLRLQREKGENVLTLLWRLLQAQGRLQAEGKTKPMGPGDLLVALMSRDSSRALKLLLARELEGAEMLLAGFEGGKEESGSVIVSERNKVALRVMRKEIASGKRRLGVFYGAGHMPDLERRLEEELSLRRKAVEWVTAWDIRKEKAAPNAGETKPESEPEAESVREGETPQGDGEAAPPRATGPSARPRAEEER